MKRLTIAELKSQKGMVLEASDSIKGGNADGCHEQVSGGTAINATTPGTVRKN
jgi:hypothetical protein